MSSAPTLELLSALIGLVAGSVIVFVAPRLVAYRLPEPIPFPPALVLVPLVGVWLTRWRWRCAAALEVGTATVFVGLALHYGAGPHLILGAAYCVLLIAIAAIDLDHRLVLNRLSYPGVVAALLGSLLWPGIGPGSALLGAVVGLAIFLALQVVGRGQLSMGDIKLAVLIGAMRGFPTVFNALLLGTILGGLGAAFALLVLQKGRKGTIAYGPYLSAGAILSFFIVSH